MKKFSPAVLNAASVRLAEIAQTYAETAAILHVSLDGKIIEVNRNFCRLLGYSRAELIRLRVAEITHPGDLAADQEGYRSFFRGDAETYNRRKRYVRKDGAVIPVIVTAILVREAVGKPAHFVGVVRPDS